MCVYILNCILYQKQQKRYFNNYFVLFLFLFFNVSLNIGNIVLADDIKNIKNMQAKKAKTNNNIENADINNKKIIDEDINEVLKDLYIKNNMVANGVIKKSDIDNGLITIKDNTNKKRDNKDNNSIKDKNNNIDEREFILNDNLSILKISNFLNGMNNKANDSPLLLNNNDNIIVRGIYNGNSGEINSNLILVFRSKIDTTKLLFSNLSNADIKKILENTNKNGLWVIVNQVLYEQDKFKHKNIPEVKQNKIIGQTLFKKDINVLINNDTRIYYVDFVSNYEIGDNVKVLFTSYKNESDKKKRVYLVANRIIIYNDLLLNRANNLKFSDNLDKKKMYYSSTNINDSDIKEIDKLKNITIISDSNNINNNSNIPKISSVVSNSNNKNNNNLNINTLETKNNNLNLNDINDINDIIKKQRDIILKNNELIENQKKEILNNQEKIKQIEDKINQIIRQQQNTGITNFNKNKNEQYNKIIESNNKNIKEKENDDGSTKNNHINNNANNNTNSSNANIKNIKGSNNEDKADNNKKGGIMIDRLQKNKIETINLHEIKEINQKINKINKMGTEINNNDKKINVQDDEKMNIKDVSIQQFQEFQFRGSQDNKDSSSQKNSKGDSIKENSNTNNNINIEEEVERIKAIKEKIELGLYK